MESYPDIAIQQEKEKKQKDAREREEKAKQEKLAKEREEKLAKERDQTLEKARQEKQAKEREEKLADVRRSADEELRREQARDLEQSRAKAERERQEAAARSAAAQAETQARMAWYDRIRSKVRSNVVVPDNIAGNPEAVFDVVLLPTGQILSATLRKSSGNKLYDEAIERALTKSSPLPLPDKQELFVRNLPPMRFTPKE